MACDGVNLLVLLLACCLVPSLARNLDISQRSFAQLEESIAQFSNSEEDTKAGSAGLFVSKKQRPMTSLEESRHFKGISVPSVLHHKTGHEENPLLQASVSHDDDTIPSLLDQNGLPIGLLPSSVASYSITDGGEFTVCLQKACYAKFDYEVYYAETITGKLSYGTITDLSGIQAKEAFFWVPVTGIRADIPSSEFIYFDVGPISKKLSISQFQTIPVCKVKAMDF